MRCREDETRRHAYLMLGRQPYAPEVSKFRLEQPKLLHIDTCNASPRRKRKKAKRHRLDNVCSSAQLPARVTDAEVCSVMPPTLDLTNSDAYGPPRTQLEQHSVRQAVVLSAVDAISPREYAGPSSAAREEDINNEYLLDIHIPGDDEEDNTGFADEPSEDASESEIALSSQQNEHALLSGEEEPRPDREESEVFASQPVYLVIYDWRVLWGLLVTNGSVKLTKSQYQSMRMLSDAFRRIAQDPCCLSATEDMISLMSRKRIASLPHYSTLFKKFKPILYKTLTVRGSSTLEKLSMRKAGARARYYSADGEVLAPVHTILPSEYAREDIACDPVFKLMKKTSLVGAAAGGDCVDRWPLVSSRAWFYGPRQYISVDECSKVASNQPFAEAGDTISFSILGSLQLRREVLEDFNSLESQHPSSITLTGEVLHIWTVHNTIRRTDDLFQSAIPTQVSPRDRDIILSLQFSSYRSPTDAVNVLIPDLPVEDGESGVDPAEMDLGSSLGSGREKCFSGDVGCNTAT